MLLIWKTINGYVPIIYLIFPICLNVGWLIYCAVKCVKIITEYRACQRTPNLHPVYRDVQYLSQQRRLYNLATLFVKNVLMLMYIAVDTISLLWLAVMSILNSLYRRKYDHSALITIVTKYPNCSIHSIIQEFYFFPSTIIMYNFQINLFILLFIILSILTRYLAARYLKHLFKATLKKYILWYLVQFIIIAACSCIYVVLILFLVFPTLLFINLCVLLRDSQFLSRALLTNLKEIALYTDNRALLKEQSSAYKFFRFFQKIMFLSLLFLVLSIFLLCLFYLFVIFYDSFCLLDILYGIDLSSDIPSHSHDKFNFEAYLNFAYLYIFLFYSFCSSFPLLSIALLPVIIGCVERYRSRHYVYRYNYENISKVRH